MTILQKHRGQAEPRIPPPCHSRMVLSGIQKVLTLQKLDSRQKISGMTEGLIS